MISKVLVINDDSISLMIATKLLRKAEFAHETLTAENGELGLSFFENGGMAAGEIPEFIFLDLFMPVMNGWDFLEIFQEKYAPLYPDVKIAIMSSYVAPDDLERLHSYDVVLDCVPTPMNFEKLAEIKDRYLKLKQTAA
jgi:CheY-like chemotaxis protein